MRIWVKVLGPTLYVVLGLVEFQKKKKTFNFGCRNILIFVYRIIICNSILVLSEL